jgi:hypothetical protein
MSRARRRKRFVNESEDVFLTKERASGRKEEDVGDDHKRENNINDFLCLRR